MAYSGKAPFRYFSLSVCSLALPEDRTGSNRFSGCMLSVLTTMTCTPKSLRSSRRDVLAPITACRAESNAVIPCRRTCPLDVPKLMKRPEKVVKHTIHSHQSRNFQIKNRILRRILSARNTRVMIVYRKTYNNMFSNKRFLKHIKISYE